MNPESYSRRVAKPFLFTLCLLPAAWLAAGIFGWEGAPLGANPVEKVQDTLGIWGLRLLLVTLSVTPLRVMLGWSRIQAFRRMLGLFAFFYISLHFLWYLFVDQAFAWRQLAADVAKRPYITAGFTAFVLLVPLAITSTKRAMRRLGRRWQKLHRLVYAAAVLGCVHFWWQVKADIREPLMYAAVLALLLGWRLWRNFGRAGVERASAAWSRRVSRERDSREDQQSSGARAPVHLFSEQPPGER